MSDYPHAKSDAEMALYALFSRENIHYRTEEHDAVFTVEESATIKGGLPGGHTKNLFLKDKDGNFALICAMSDTEIKINKLHPHLGMRRLSFGKAEALEALLGVQPGSVTLFSIINDADHKVQLILDKALFDHETVWFHPLRNTASTAISSEDLERFSKAAGHAPIIMDFKALSDAT